MSLYSMLQPKGPNGYGYGSTAEDVTRGLDLSGRTILLTGCNSGIGFETLRVLAMRGAHVVGAARSESKAREAGERAGAQITPLACELEDPSSVRAAVAKVKELGRELDAIVCNAGIMALPKRELVHGWEKQLYTNHVGHFMLVTGVSDQLGERGRVVMLSSEAHRAAPRVGIDFDDIGAERSYSPWAAYGQSKLANLLFAKELSRRFAGSKRTANAAHPGVIRTNLGRHMNPVAWAVFGLAGPLVLKSVGEGAATQCYLAVHPGAEGVTGQYYADCNPAKPRGDADDPALAQRLWDETEKLVARI
jgi:WW domain-containing oxidoreductase